MTDTKATTFLRPHQAFNVGSFNIRRLQQSWQQAALHCSLTISDIDICCPFETHLYDSTTVLRIQPPSPQGQNVFDARFLGDTDVIAKRRNGVGIVLSQRAESCLRNWIHGSSRLCETKLESSFRSSRNQQTKSCFSIIAASTPTDCSTNSMKDGFHSQLDELLRKTKATDTIRLTRDMNAEVCRLSIAELHLSGWYVVDTHRNDNKERLLQVCAVHQLFIASINFHHRRRYLTTWCSTSHSQTLTRIYPCWALHVGVAPYTIVVRFGIRTQNPVTLS